MRFQGQGHSYRFQPPALQQYRPPLPPPEAAFGRLQANTLILPTQLYEHLTKHLHQHNSITADQYPINTPLSTLRRTTPLWSLMGSRWITSFSSVLFSFLGTFSCPRITSALLFFPPCTGPLGCAAPQTSTPWSVAWFDTVLPCVF